MIFVCERDVEKIVGGAHGCSCCCCNRGRKERQEQRLPVGERGDVAAAGHAKK